MQTPVQAALAFARKLKGPERRQFLQTLAQERGYRSAMEDITDGLLIETRRNEPSRPLSEYLADRRRQSR